MMTRRQRPRPKLAELRQEQVIFAVQRVDLDWMVVVHFAPFAVLVPQSEQVSSSEVRLVPWQDLERSCWGRDSADEGWHWPCFDLVR